MERKARGGYRGGSQHGGQGGGYGHYRGRGGYRGGCDGRTQYWRNQYRRIEGKKEMRQHQTTLGRKGQTREQHVLLRSDLEQRLRSLRRFQSKLDDLEPRMDTRRDRLAFKKVTEDALGGDSAADFKCAVGETFTMSMKKAKTFIHNAPTFIEKEGEVNVLRDNGNALDGSVETRLDKDQHLGNQRSNFISRGKKSYKEAILTPPTAPEFANINLSKKDNDQGVRLRVTRSIAGRCSRCLGRDHRVAVCRDPIRCLRCFKTGHRVRQCREGLYRRNDNMFRGQHLRGRVAVMRTFVPYTEDFFTRRELRQNALLADIVDGVNIGQSPQLTIANALADRFGGYPTDFMVARYRERSFAIFLPQWVLAETLVRRQIITLEGFWLRCYPWGPYRNAAPYRPTFKAWIRLLNLPFECWTVARVSAIVSGFGRFIRADESTRQMTDLRAFRCRIAVSDLRDIPQNLSVVLGDEAFSVLVHIDEWERDGDNGNDENPPPPAPPPSGGSVGGDDRRNDRPNRGHGGDRNAGGDEEMGGVNSAGEVGRTERSVNGCGRRAVNASASAVVMVRNIFGSLLESMEPAREPRTRNFGKTDIGGFDGRADPRWRRIPGGSPENGGEHALGAPMPLTALAPVALSALSEVQSSRTRSRVQSFWFEEGRLEDAFVKMVVFRIRMESGENRSFLFYAVLGCATKGWRVEELSVVNEMASIDKGVDSIYYWSIKGVVGMYGLRNVGCKFTLGQVCGAHKQSFNDGCGSSLIELTWPGAILIHVGSGSGVSRRIIVGRSLIKLTWNGPSLFHVGCGSSVGRRIIVTSWNGPTFSRDVGPGEKDRTLGSEFSLDKVGGLAWSIGAIFGICLGSSSVKESAISMQFVQMSFNSPEEIVLGGGQGGQRESDFELASTMDSQMQMGTKGVTSPRRLSARLANGTRESSTCKAMARKARLKEGSETDTTDIIRKYGRKKIKKKSERCGVRLGDSETKSFGAFLCGSA